MSTASKPARPTNPEADISCATKTGHLEKLLTVFDELAVAARGRAVVEGQKVLRRFVEKGAAVVIEAPKPVFKTPTFRCAEPYNRSLAICAAGSSVARRELEALRQPILEALKAMSDGVSGVYIWDPFPLLCPKGPWCSEYDKGRPLFFDGDHLSGYGNRLLAPSFQEFMIDVQRRLGCRTNGWVLPAFLGEGRLSEP